MTPQAYTRSFSPEGGTLAAAAASMTGAGGEPRSRSRSRSCDRSPPAAPATVRLRITQISGTLLTELDVEELERIDDVKKKLARVAEAPRKYIRLLFGARELQDERTVSEEGLSQEATLVIVRCALEACSLLAVPEDDPLLVPFFINSGADPNETDENGWSALHWASHRGQVATGEALLACEEFEAVNQQDIGRMTALHSFAHHGHVNLCRAIVNRSDFSVLNDRASNGNTALHWAARSSHADVCEALLGLDGYRAVNDQNVYGWTALHYAAAAGLTGICEKLLGHPHFDAVDELTNNGETALHWAALNGRLEVCKLLLGRLDAAVPDVEGMTALDGAQRHGHKAVCELLRS
uniref:Ubiquitin-like domain-containing protein n=1 Tax=Alexandrium monilatum TaxID=311494 RepID=A0A7S4PYU7_9DINO